MNKRFIITLIGLTAFGPAYSRDPIMIGAVGTHVIEVAQRGERYQLVAVPFLKLPLARGRLDGVDAGTGTVTDDEGAFGALPTGQACILRIRSGSEKGSWFVVEESVDGYADSPTRLNVNEDARAGNLANLEGNEVFSVHPLFTIAEVFPEDGSVLPAGDLDLRAGQVHVWDGAEFAKYWLSDGTITDQPGWHLAEGSELRRAGDDALLPGASFFAVHPDATETVEVRVMGEVLTDAIRVPLFEGFNFVTAEYNLSRTDPGGAPSFALNDIGLVESGFYPGFTEEAGDHLLVFDPNQIDFGSGYWLRDLGTGQAEWNRLSEVTGNVGQEEVRPGEGFVIWNSGEAYYWLHGQ